MNYQEINSRTIDSWVDEGWEWGTPITPEAFQAAREGRWDIVLTPTKAVPHEWVGPLEGRHVLGLASGGGQQIPILTALGARCTVLDYSQRQLDMERLVAGREGYEVTLVKADMTRPLPFEDESFDLIINPVSLCYVESVEPILKECHRVLKPGGRLLIGFDNGINYIVDEKEEGIAHGLPFNPLTNPSLYNEDDGVQFSHSFTEQVGGLARAGFQILDAYDDTNGEGRLHELGIPSFWALLAIKPVMC